jgi:hypothetical protein
MKFAHVLSMLLCGTFVSSHTSILSYVDFFLWKWNEAH